MYNSKFNIYNVDEVTQQHARFRNTKTFVMQDKNYE